METVTASKWQTLMDEAYAAWPCDAEGNKKSYSDFIASLSGVRRAAVLLGNLNYQVQNGGFIQWIDNRYIDEIGLVFDALGVISGDATKEVVDILLDLNDEYELYDQAVDDIRKVSDEYSDSIGMYKTELLRTLDDCLTDVADDCSVRFFKLEDRFEKEVEAWIDANVT